VGPRCGKRVRLRRRFGVSCPDFDIPAIPHYTDGRDLEDDPVVHTALAGGAFALVSDDGKHIALSDDDPTIYTSESGARVPAFQFQNFIDAS
jgi:hypothetical protein